MRLQRTERLPTQQAQSQPRHRISLLGARRRPTRYQTLFVSDSAMGKKAGQALLPNFSGGSVLFKLLPCSSDYSGGPAKNKLFRKKINAVSQYLGSTRDFGKNNGVYS